MKKSLILLLLASSTLLASIGEVTALRGEAQLIRDGAEKGVVVGTTLEEHDVLKTAAKSKLQITFEDNTVISLGQKSNFKIDEYLFTEDKVAAKFSVANGFFKSITGRIGKISPEKFKIKTANATIGVRGTTIIGEVTSKRDIIACSSGQIVVSNAAGSMVVNAGERTIVEEMKSPKQSQKINTVLLKQFDAKSNPLIVEVESEVQIPVIEKETVKEVKDTDSEKTAEKFEPWIEEKKEQTLQDIEKIIGTSKPSYYGKITEGTTSHGVIDSDSSNVNLNFDLGSGKMDGNLDFRDTQEQYDIQVEGAVKGDGSFDFSSSNGYEGSGKGDLNGENFEHANGDVGFQEQNIDGSSNEIKATFETTILEEERR